MKSWQIPCTVCGEVSFSTYKGHHFCEGCWDDFRKLQGHVDWTADPAFLVQYLKGKKR